MTDSSSGGPADALAGIERQIWVRNKRGPAPVEQWEPDRQGAIDIRIARDGTWYHEGSPIRRIGMVQLFASILRRDPDGQYFLVTPVEKLSIQVDDAPFVAVEMQVEGTGRDQRISLRTNLDDWITADTAHPLRIQINPADDQPAPYIHVRGRLEALLNRAIFYDLIQLCVDEVRDGTSQFGVWSAGEFFAFTESDQLQKD